VDNLYPWHQILILGVFSDELAKELSSFFDAAEFLAIK
jgi:hypothetical protein